MKNLAGVQTCDVDIRNELEAAGINIKEVEGTLGEVPYTLVGELGRWTFCRAWYYWIAVAPDDEGIPESHAEEFNSRWREQVRVAGFAGGTEVTERLSSRHTIDSYHIDTQAGLNAFADLVRKLAE